MVSGRFGMNSLLKVFFSVVRWVVCCGSDC